MVTQHVFSPHLYCIKFIKMFSISSQPLFFPIMVKNKGKHRVNFTLQETKALLEVIEKYLPIGTEEWRKVEEEHATKYPLQQSNAKSLKRKFLQWTGRQSAPSGDPNCPAYIT